jgi:exodeoxyribonuclease X
MKNLIFFDTETTGNTEKDYLCQIAYKIGDDIFTSIYKPPIPIPPEASAVHHITNKMVADKITFAESEDLKKIKRIFEDDNSVVVAHNAPFDLNIIKKEGIIPKYFICTLRVVRYLDVEGKMSRYNLQYLRYLLEIEIKEAVAHDAKGDVLVLEKLFQWLKNKIKKEEGLNENETIEKMIEISSKPSLLRKFNFGKHNGKSVEEVAITDRGYLEWLLGQKLSAGVPDEEWIYTLKHYLGK